MRHAWSVALLAAGLLWSGAARAETRPGQSLLDLGVGAGVPLSGLDLARFGGGSERPGEAGLAINPRYLYQARERLAFGGEVAYTGFPDRAVPLRGGFGVAGGGAFSAEGLARYLVDPKARVSPYIIGGVGLVEFAAHVRAPDGDTLLDSSSVGLALSAGAGVQVELDERLVAAGEACWRLGTVDDGLFGTDVYNALALTARLGWRF